MPKDYKTDPDIKELQALIDGLKKANGALLKKDPFEDFEKATELTKGLVSKFDTLCANENLDLLQRFFAELQPLVSDLHKIAKNQTKNAPRPYQIIDTITTSFENFINAIISKGHKKDLMFIAERIPVVDMLVLCCKSMPYYWPYATRNEKVGMLLSIVLMAIATALVITAATTLSALIPPLAVVPIAGVVIVTCSKYGKDLFKHIIDKSENRHKRMKEVKELGKQLDEREALLEQRMQEFFPPPKPGNHPGKPLINSDIHATHPHPHTSPEQKDLHPILDPSSIFSMRSTDKGARHDSWT